jgi:glutathione reductase (NADPH)
MAEFDVDLFVIGAGSGGVRAARISAGYGAKVMIAEEFRVGGTCVIRGCVPKKLYAYASRFGDDFADAEGYGWSFPQKPVFDWRTLVEAKEREITRLSGIYRANLERAGVLVEETRATIEDANTIRLSEGGRLIRARTILVATGATPMLEPDIPGLQNAISSNEIFDLACLPKSLLIVGGGYIAVEFASLLARLGVAVTMCMRADNVLRGFDEDMRTGLRDALIHAGINFQFGTLPTKIERTPSGKNALLSNGTQAVYDEILLATGRKPHTNGLGLEKAGVELDDSGAIKVDEYSRSSVPSIYAVGDVTNRLNLTPVAIREGHAFADTVFGDKPVIVSHKKVPTAVFTTPEIGTVGMSEQAARQAYDIVDIYQTSFRPMKAVLSGRTERTIMKIIVDGKTDVVLGVHILGHEAGEMAQVLGIAVHMGAKKADFDATMAVHPTAAEELVTMRTRSARHTR